ncbi:MAG TPA: hypothetical protein VHB27_04360 [Rhodopila sp.]|uniref:hypothetical protein n=1 Tax=Rhodopila sp. TaxID=2480087 RepID=UPI002C136E9E|nr:hypothetical protein [Rhodopila sp.]HVY14436.1 hypothetical protein [Rhodopila sp.]
MANNAAPLPSASGPTPAGGGANPTEADPAQAIEQALSELQQANQRLVTHGLPAKAGEEQVAKLRGREPTAAKAGAKAQQALLKDIETARDAARKEADLLTEITAILADADAQAAQLQADGLPVGQVTDTIAGLRKRMAAAASGGVAALTKFRGAAAQMRDRIKGDADKQRTAQTGGAVDAIKDLRDTASDQIDQITDGTAKDPLVKDLAALNKMIDALQQQKDPAKFAPARDAADAAARALLKQTAAASPDKKKAKTALRGAYQKALKERYGIDLGGNKDQTAEHIDLEQVYETLESMPVGHVAHKKMKNITYTARLRSGNHGIGMYNGAGMELGEIEGDTDGYRDPTHPKEKPQVPRLAITVLHELGHSVDGRWGIMDGDISKDGYGGWRSFSGLEAVAQELAAVYLNGGQAGGADTDALVKAIVAVINKRTDIEVPEDMQDPAARKKFEAFLHRCGNIMSEDFNGRGFSFSNGHWHSYSRTVRAKTQVTNYQWSAPGEWFAELYAMTWYLKRDPPSDIDPKVKLYLYSSKTGGAGPGAPGQPGA